MEVYPDEIEGNMLELESMIQMFNINLGKVDIKNSEIAIKKSEIQQKKDMIELLKLFIKSKVRTYNILENQKKLIVDEMNSNLSEINGKSNDIQMKIAEIQNNSGENQLSHEVRIQLLEIEKIILQNKNSMLQNLFMTTWSKER